LRAVQVNSAWYSILFVTAVSVVCALLVAASTILLKDRQRANQKLFVQKNVLLEVTGLVTSNDLSAEELASIFERRIRARLVDLETGEYVKHPEVDPISYDQREARNDPARSRPAPDNDAQVKRLPKLAGVYLVMDGERAEQVVIPIEGNGLYGTLYGFLALDRDTTTIRGLAYYENKETPGLGGEVNNPRWKALWPGRRAFDEKWVPRIEVIKGAAGPPEKDPHRVDGLSGATMTSNGVTNMLALWLGEDGFGPYLAKVRARGEL
jgi:Na+-transporting NADH:ubiquinone oxidoreductase subunit C